MTKWALLFVGVLYAGALPAAFGQTIQNDQQYIGDDGVLHIVGEIVNDVDVPLAGTTVHIAIFDANDKNVLTKEARSLVNTIMPGMKGPFDLMLTDNQLAEVGIDKDEVTYAMELDYDFTIPKMQVIDITESDLSRDRHNNLIISGTVTNGGEITANTISVVATLYDDAGSVAAVARVHPEPDYLRAGESAFFIISVLDKVHAAEIGKYHLTAESEEYAAVPEFPIGTGILLAVTFLAYVVITSRFVRIPTTSLISAEDSR